MKLTDEADNALLDALTKAASTEWLIRRVGRRNHVAGMTLRDYFAAKVLPAAIACEVNNGSTMIQPPAFRFQLVAKTSYDMADAMLKERAK